MDKFDENNQKIYQNTSKFTQKRLSQSSYLGLTCVSLKIIKNKIKTIIISIKIFLDINRSIYKLCNSHVG
jgi:hypothetical protein